MAFDWADEARVMFRPFTTYRALGQTLEADRRGEDGRGRSRARSVWLFVRRPLLFLLVAGGFVSFTTSGRWIWVHVVSAMVMWSFAPLYMTAWVLAVSRVFMRDRSRARPLSELVDLYFVGQGPWLLFFLALAGVCLFAPEVWPAFRWLLDSDVLFGIFVAVIAWGVFLTFAFFKDGLALRTPVAALATLVFYIVLDGTAVGWFVVTGQLFPLLSEARG